MVPQDTRGMKRKRLARWRDAIDPRSADTKNAIVPGIVFRLVNKLGGKGHRGPLQAEPTTSAMPSPRHRAASEM